MINDEVRKALHCIEDFTERKNNSKDNWSYGLFTHSLSLVAGTFQKEKFFDYINNFIINSYKNNILIDEINKLNICSTAVEVFNKSNSLESRIFIDRGREIVDKDNTTMPQSLRLKNKVFNYIKKYMPHIIKIEDLLSFVLFSTEYSNNFSDDKIIDYCNRKLKLYTTILFDKNNDLIVSSINTRNKTRYPLNGYILASSGYYLLCLSFLFDFLKLNFINSEYIKIYKKLCCNLLNYQKDDGYFPITSLELGQKDDSLATLLIASAFFYGYRKGLLDKGYYDSAVKAYNRVIDGLKLKNELLSLPNVSVIPQILRYISINGLIRYNDLATGIAALNYATVNYEKCLSIIPS